MHGDIFGFLFAAAFETGNILKYSRLYWKPAEKITKSLLSAYIHISPLK